MEDNKLVQGLYYNEARLNAPDFVVAGLSVHKEKFQKWLLEQDHNNGYVNIDILTSKAGNIYMKVNDFKSKKKENQVEKEPNTSNLPF